MTNIPPTVRWRRDRAIPELASATSFGELLREGYQPQAHSWLLHQAPETVEASLRRLASVGCLEWSADELIARPTHQSPGYLEPRSSPSPKVLSRFVFLQIDGDDWKLQSARSHWCVHLPASSIIRLASGTLSESEWDLLDRCGFLVSDDKLELGTAWDFHDRLFADRSREDFRVKPTEMHKGVTPSPAPVLDRFPGAPCVQLPTPTGPRVNEPSLWTAMEGRRTPLPFPSLPLSLDQLSELLYRTLRVMHIQDSPEDDVRGYVRRWRPVPSGGAMHGIDTWISAAHVEGLAPGWYWYRPADHSLVAVPHSGDPIASDVAPATFWFTTHHARTSWKYGSISLALELKDMGVIMYAIQLAAQALDLSVQLHGSGSTQQFSEVLGIDPEVDCPVGELIISARKGGIPA